MIYGAAKKEWLVEESRINVKILKNVVMEQLNASLQKMKLAVVQPKRIAHAVKIKKFAARLQRTNGAVNEGKNVVIKRMIAKEI